MKKRILWACAVLVLAACSDDNDPVILNSVALEVNADIEGIHTRASETSWASDDQIGISSTTDDYANVPYKYNGAKFEAAGSPIRFQSAGETLTFNAYYSYAAEGGVIEHTITADDQSAANQPKIDYLFASGATAKYSDPTVNFTEDHAFSHCMSQVRIAFQEGENVTLTGNLTEYTLTGLVMAGSFNTATGVAAADGTSADLAIPLPDVTTTQGVYTASPILLFPQNTTGFELKLKIDGKDCTATLTVPDGKFASGNAYKYTIEVVKHSEPDPGPDEYELKIVNATIKPWDSSREYTGTAEMQ